jgi:NAD(P)-dependent dehydrogenase (short-subunit alcohol dehydrogenase family)
VGGHDAVPVTKLFLASDEARYITGVTLPVAAGVTLPVAAGAVIK